MSRGSREFWYSTLISISDFEHHSRHSKSVIVLGETLVINPYFIGFFLEFLFFVIPEVTNKDFFK